MEISQSNSRRVCMVPTETPLLVLQMRDVRKVVDRIPLSWCGDDGGRETNPIGYSRARLSSSPPVTQEALSRPGASLSCYCATSLAIRRSQPSPTWIHHHLRVVLIIFIGIATAIRNGADGLGELTARGRSLTYSGERNRNARGMTSFSDLVLLSSFPTR
jgi:hypothetical protein